MGGEEGGLFILSTFDGGGLFILSTFDGGRGGGGIIYFKHVWGGERRGAYLF